MKKITIIKESTPTRCDICHKNDNFNQKTSYCSRCDNIVTSGFKNEIIDLSQIGSSLEEQKLPLNSVKIEDLGFSYTIIYKWFTRAKIPWLLVIMLGVVPNLIGLWAILVASEPYKLPFYWVNITVNLLLVSVYVLALIMMVLNKTYIKIMNNQIIITTKPINFFSQKIIDIFKIVDILYKDNLVNASIQLLLTNGKKILLIEDSNKKSIKLIENILKEKLIKIK